MYAVTVYSDFGGQENKIYHCFHFSPFYLPWNDGTGCHEMMGPDAMTLVVLLLNFKPAFSLSSFIFIKRFFSSTSLSTIRVASSANLMLLIFLPAILISVSDSSYPEFHMMYSAHKLNKEDNNIQPWHTPFPILNQSIVPCPVLTVASWPAHRFLRRQVRWSGIPISLRIFHSFFLRGIYGSTNLNSFSISTIPVYEM